MNLPTKITFSRIIAIVGLITALFIMNVIPSWQTIVLGKSGINLVFLIVFIFFLIACYTDHLDGKLARKNNQVTDLGKFLDPVADKLLINSMVIFLTAPQIFARYVPNGDKVANFNVWCAIILVARDIVVDALRFIGAQKGIVIAANVFGKLKTVFQMIAICVVLLNGFPFTFIEGEAHIIFANVFVYLATATSFISGVIYVVQNRKVFTNSNENK